LLVAATPANRSPKPSNTTSIALVIFAARARLCGRNRSLTKPGIMLGGSTATIRAEKSLNHRDFYRFSSQGKENSGSPARGFFVGVTLVPHYPFTLLSIALCVELAVKYDAAATLRARLSPRP
jgi:hypothetical protein